MRLLNNLSNYYYTMNKFLNHLGKNLMGKKHSRILHKNTFDCYFTSMRCSSSLSFNRWHMVQRIYCTHKMCYFIYTSLSCTYLHMLFLQDIIHYNILYITLDLKHILHSFYRIIDISCLLNSKFLGK